MHYIPEHPLVDSITDTQGSSAYIRGSFADIWGDLWRTYEGLFGRHMGGSFADMWRALLPTCGGLLPCVTLCNYVPENALVHAETERAVI